MFVWGCEEFLVNEDGSAISYPRVVGIHTSSIYSRCRFSSTTLFHFHLMIVAQGTFVTNCQYVCMMNALNDKLH